MLKLLPSFYKNNDIKIETPDGLEHFFGIQKIHRSKYIELEFLDDTKLICSLNHPIHTTDGVIMAKDLKKTDEVITKNNNTFLTKKKTVRKKIELFDIVNAGQKHWYYTSNVVSSNCSFLGSVATLISATKIETFVSTTPIDSNEHTRIHKKPDPSRRYMITVDVAQGVEEDFSVAMVMDITTIPYSIAAIYSNNTIAPIVFPNIILKLANEYNKAFVLIELNALGSQVADILHYDLEYSNLLMTAMVGRSGLVLGQNFSKRSKFGLQITKSTKRLGCSNLKSLIETDKLLVEDFGVISELTTYIAKGDSYAADDSSNDDLVACLVLFSWCVSQPYFKELTDINTHEAITEVYRQEIEEQAELLGWMLINGSEIENETEIDNDGTLWSNVVENETWEFGDVSSLWSFT